MGRGVRKAGARRARQKSGVNGDLHKNKLDAEAYASARANERLDRNGDFANGPIGGPEPLAASHYTRLVDLQNLDNASIKRGGDFMNGALGGPPPSAPSHYARLVEVEGAHANANGRLSRNGDFANGPVGGPAPTAPGHYARKAETDAAQAAAVSANANANGRIPNAANAVSNGHLAPGIGGSKLGDRTLGGIKMIVGTVGQAELNANTRNEAAAVSSMRTLDGTAGSAQPYCYTPFMHLEKAERLGRLGTRKRLRESHRKGDAGTIAALAARVGVLEEALLMSLSMQMDYSGMSGDEREEWIEGGSPEAVEYKRKVGVDEYRGWRDPALEEVLEEARAQQDAADATLEEQEDAEPPNHRR
ncbi:hypothetical protein GBA65_14860 [Rubrobacter marinus]|uniref:Uncharacterized protein n=1 Tax=Rubrobacter marinus TaxID=2653852 RepID=A0A6G8PZP7_9ACTN|nr:hypothetical protein [Rubrobacter marinus]QIN79587.1 hypothetical protein GBA65_14860 [Rubrobacter marinus]